MKRLLSIIIVLFFLSNMVFSQPVKEYEILSVKAGDIIIDGSMKEAVWNAAKFTDDFLILKNSTKPLLQTRAKILWDADNMYVAFEVMDNDIYANEIVQDAEFYERDDLVELYIDPNGDGKNYLELGVSAKGTTYDYVIRTTDPWMDDKEWDISNCSAKSLIHGTLNNDKDKDSGYVVEMKIPFASLNYENFGVTLPVKSGAIWRGNLCRYDYTSLSKKNEFKEEASWAIIGESDLGPHMPNKFGKFIFSSTQATTIQKNTFSTTVGKKRFRIIKSEQRISFQFDKLVSKNATMMIYSPVGRVIDVIPLGSQNCNSRRIPQGMYIGKLVDGIVTDVQSFVVH